MRSWEKNASLERIRERFGSRRFDREIGEIPGCHPSSPIRLRATHGLACT